MTDYNLTVTDLTIDGFDIAAAVIKNFRNKFFWEAHCANGLEYSSVEKSHKRLYNTPADAIIAFTKRCCQQNLRGRTK
jgi:hypothetical protein